MQSGRSAARDGAGGREPDSGLGEGPAGKIPVGAGTLVRAAVPGYGPQPDIVQKTRILRATAGARFQFFPAAPHAPLPRFPMSKPAARPVKMADLARHLQLARSTVSMALRHHPEIAAATRERVHAAAAQLGYRPNPLVSALMASLHQSRPAAAGTVLAVIDQHPADADWRTLPLLDLLAAGLAGQAQRLGYSLQSFKLGRGGLSPARLASVLRARGIRGAVLAPVPNAGPSFFRGWEHLAVATMNWSVAEPAMHRAASHYFHNIGLAWDQLAARGFRRIGFVYNRAHSERIGHAYLGGFLSRHHRQAPAQRVEPLLTDAVVELTVERLRQWHRRERPDAVIFAEGSFVLPRLREIARVPAELSLAVLETGSAPPGCAGIDERSALVGASALDLVVNQLHRNERGLPAVPQVVHVPGTWRDGDTVRS